MFLEGINTILQDMPEIDEIHLATEGKQVLRVSVPRSTSCKLE